MSSDADNHREMISGLKAATGKGDNSFEQAVTSAFEYVFDHLERLHSHVSPGRHDGEDRALKLGESPTQR